MAEVMVPIGPQHPALKEPVNFKVFAEGEIITRLELDLSYNHRGIEKAAESRDFTRVVPLLERICGICSHSHTTNFVKGVEEAMGVTPPPRAQYIRTLIAELERLHSHMLWLGVGGHEIGFNTLLMWTWRDREDIQDTLEEMTGNRVNYGTNKVGGVRRDLAPDQIDRAHKRFDTLEERFQGYAEMATQNPTIRERFQGVGELTREQALALGTVGPTARASGVDYDIRRDDPYCAYPDMKFQVVTEESGDVFGRTLVRVREMMESLKICRQLLADLPEGPIAAKSPRTAPKADVISRYEAPRGELVHTILTDGSDHVARLDIRTPTLANWTSVAASLPGAHLADIPVVVAAIDPCLSCTSRVTVVDTRGRKPTSYTWDELRAWGIDRHAGRRRRS